MEKQNSAKPGQEARSQTTTSTTAQRVRGAVLAAACANSLGGSSIGLNHKEILATAGAALRDFAPGLSRSVLPGHKAGDWLSDNYLAVALAESLLSNDGKYVEADLKQRFKGLLEDDAFLSAGPGAYCLSLMRRVADGGEAAEDAREAQHVSGAARAFPAGLLPDAEQAVDVSIQQARLTQPDKRVHAAAAVLADSIHFFAQGNRLDTEEEVRLYVKREFALAERIDARFAESWDDVAPDLNYSEPASELPYSLLNIGSDVGELVPTAVGIFLIFRHCLEEAVCAAAVAGGDTDTLSIIVGALSGAYHGENAIPERWLEKIAERERLDKIADGFARLWAK